MRIFVYEYACAQPETGSELSTVLGNRNDSWPGPGEPQSVTLTAAIRREGRAMRDAIASDCRAAGYDVLTLGGCEATDEREAFFDCLRQADAALIIAPELEHILTTRCQWVESRGVLLLGTPARALVQITDKWHQYLRLRRYRIPVPETWRAPPTGVRKLVRKPRLGAGSWQVRLVGTDADFADGMSGPIRLEQVQLACTYADADANSAQADPDTVASPWPNSGSSPLVSFAAEVGSSAWLWQRYVPGVAASIACLCGKDRRVLLRAGYQLLSDDGRFRYLGGELPLPPALEQRARRLADAALTAFPELRGYVGFDLVLGKDPGGNDDYLIEINTRLTTSYLGQRQLCRQNLAGMLVGLLTGQPIAEPSWHPGRVRFHP